MFKIKLLTIVVPAYNSQDYLARCLDTLVAGEPQDVEVIVVDDGSTDGTAALARTYCERYPGTVRLEQKENGGHGSAINRGLAAATGVYFKVVDSDDWLDGPSYGKVLAQLRREASGRGNLLDMLICNYVYEYRYNNTQYTVSYRNVLTEGVRFTWDNFPRFRINQLLLMHSIIYRTGLLRECGLRLPEHTFYVDNFYAYQPLPHVKTMLYLDCDLYRYFIGRPDQSVNTANMIRRIDQQLLVTNLMVKSCNVYDDIANKNLRRYMLHYLSMMVTISIIHLILSQDEAKYPKIGELWESIRRTDERTYAALRRNVLNIGISLPGRSGRYIARKGFQLAQHIYKFS